MNLTDLALLDKPEIIKSFKYEEILAQTKSRIVEAFNAREIDYDVDTLETDPAIIVSEAKAFDEHKLFTRTNEVARSRLLFFSTGSDLDHFVAPWVERMEGETDERLKQRYILAILGRSEERYKSAAMSAHIDVEAVAVYKRGSGPELEIAVLSTQNDGVASQELLDAVSLKIKNESGRSINDVNYFVSAVKTNVEIVADVWLYSETDVNVIAILSQHLKEAWNALSVMGRDLTPSWIIRELHGLGVQRVELLDFERPITALENEAIAIDKVTINFKGRDS